MKLFLLVFLFYVLPAILVYLCCKSLANKIKRYMGKTVYEAYSRYSKEERSVIDYIKLSLCLLVPVLNILCLCILITHEDDIYLRTLNSIEKDFKRWGIDFQNSIEVNKNDYNIALDELNGLRRL